jgi:hypothetical protein
MSMDYTRYCPVARTLDVIGDRWTTLILRDLMVDGPAQVHGFPVFARAHQPDHAFRPAQEPLRSTASSIVGSTRTTHRGPSICSHRKARICDRSCAPCAFAATSTRSHQESSLRCDLAGKAASISVLCQLLKAHCSRTPQLANRLVQSPLWAPLDCHPWVVTLASGPSRNWQWVGVAGARYAASPWVLVALIADDVAEQLPRLTFEAL